MQLFCGCKYANFLTNLAIKNGKKLRDKVLSQHNWKIKYHNAEIYGYLKTFGCYHEDFSFRKHFVGVM